ncbi:hypothetical protein GCM10007978_49790 [Shewanella hanedai]|uniref:RHS repeat domain-containing protein n=1 Tax=Shewanella hanedai TaxID=25 RepID=UPI00199CB5AC|nr:RHS repeat-associated core domain-containing protein [Shewanella hanedai]GGJ06219.1 hypothetical protein GCM10007978_49790 [Shewanella hanedai]
MFGRPRDIAAGNALLTDWQGVSRGFTDHEHLADQELIHMNGRVYDYNVGRFLSVDPFLQFPENSQSANPYSYILNNPMSGVDPTGYSSVRSGNASNWRVAMCDSNHGNTCAKTPVDNVLAQWGLSNGQANKSMAKSGQKKRKDEEAHQRVGEEEEIAQGGGGPAWTSDGKASSAPSSFNGTETASTGVMSGPFGLPMPGPKSPEQIANDKAAAKALSGLMSDIAGAIASPPPPDDEDKVEIRQPSRKVEKFENTISESHFNTSPRYQLVNKNGRWKTVDGNGNAFTPKGEYEFVTQNGQIWVSRTGTGHYNIARGANSVDYAGHIRFGYGNNSGLLRGWNNNSGHYKPTAGRAWQAKLPSEKFGKL